MILDEQQAQILLHHVLDTLPQEACGLIAGRDAVAQSIVPLPNVASDPLHGYEMDHQSFVKAMFAIERHGLSLIGFFHSHPDGPPTPSPTDIRLAYYPEVAYVIVGFHHAQPRIAAWHICNQSVEPAELHIGARPANIMASPIADTLGQKTALVVSAVLTFILVLIVALTLLPPPPPLTG